MYKYIIDPVTTNKIKINSLLGKNIIYNYINQLNLQFGGAAVSVASPESNYLVENFNEILRKLIINQKSEKTKMLSYKDNIINIAIGLFSENENNAIFIIFCNLYRGGTRSENKNYYAIGLPEYVKLIKNQVNHIRDNLRASVMINYEGNEINPNEYHFYKIPESLLNFWINIINTLDKDSLSKEIDCICEEEQICCYLGNAPHQEYGCKTHVNQDKLNEIIKVFMDNTIMLIEFININKLEKIFFASSQIIIFIIFIRNLMAFYSSKSLNNTYDKFHKFTIDINTLFKKEIFRWICNDSHPGCGRKYTDDIKTPFILDAKDEYLIL